VWVDLGVCSHQDVEQARGETPEQAASTAGMVTGIAQTCALVFAVFAGLISTKLNAMLALQLMAVTAAVGYAGYGQLRITSDLVEPLAHIRTLFDGAVSTASASRTTRRAATACSLPVSSASAKLASLSAHSH